MSRASDLFGMAKERVLGKLAYDSYTEGRRYHATVNKEDVEEYPEWEALSANEQAGWVDAAQRITEERAMAIHMLNSSAMHCSICMTMIQSRNANWVCQVEWEAKSGAYGTQAVMRKHDIDYIMRRPEFQRIVIIRSANGDSMGYWADTIIHGEPRCSWHVWSEAPPPQRGY